MPSRGLPLHPPYFVQPHVSACCSTSGASSPSCPLEDGCMETQHLCRDHGSLPPSTLPRTARTSGGSCLSVAFFFSADNCRKRGSSAVITCLISPRPFACCECAVPKQPSAAAQLVPNHSGPKPQPGLVLGAQPGAIPCPQFPYVQSKCQVRGCSSQLALSVPCTVLDRQTLKDFAMWLSWDGPVLGTGGRMAILDAAKGRARLSALNCPPGE